ncbi:MAG: type II restriction endonuclease subunit M [Clostridia bacterium]|nr:type II restriction endonuclease subunit M [Clostridia bacterium]
MAENVTYRFIQNVGDYFPSGYFTEDFIDKVQKCAGRSSDDMTELNKPFVKLRAGYETYKNEIINGHLRPKDAITWTHCWHTDLLKTLGYNADNVYTEAYVTAEKEDITEIIPVRHVLRSGDRVSLLIMEMQNLIAVGDQQPAGLFDQQYESEPDKTTGQQRYSAAQWADVIDEKYLDRTKYKFSPAIINKAITEIFLMPQERRPHYILMLAGNVVFLFDQEKWARGSYLQFSIDDLFAQGQIRALRNYYALFYLLVSKEALAADGQTVLMDTLVEESYKKAYEVTKDLKEGVILAVETFANEALYYMKNVAQQPFGKRIEHEDGTVTYDETDDGFESEIKDDCLTIVYRLLFILFAESRPELEILPTNDEVYKRGYSFESLRDLEQVRLISDDSRNGYFFDDSIRHLFRILSSGYHSGSDANVDKSFRTRPIDSPIFNDDRLHHLKDVKIRNSKWQEIIQSLSLSHGKYCGRISYANLGINQLGSVYESLLAYRGFYAEEDYIEVFKPGKLEEGTFLVPYSRMEAFDISEVLCDNVTGEPKKLPKGTFVYRLNGRDRQKSASYYTPEVLTKSTVKYTIKEIVDEVREGKRKPVELLDLKILEPAVGAAAFLNEVINQLADAYMTYTEKKTSPDKYRDQLQKVKAYIATHNVYGVDLNPTAIELGKLSLWLNVIHKDMETPFFANRMAVGNAVIGAWLKVYSKDEVVSKANEYKTKIIPAEWWTKAPHKVKFFRNRVNRLTDEVYHFLLPDKNMLGALGIKEMKETHPVETRRMRDRLNDWTKPIDPMDFLTLQKLSGKIDILLREHFETQVNIERLTNNRNDIWPKEKTGSLYENQMQEERYAEKERIFDTRYRRDNAYYKLKMVMDYWCSLWFWEFEDAKDLPTRDEYWREIDKLLDVSDEKLNASTLRAFSKRNYAYVADPQLEYNSERLTEAEAMIVEKSKEEILEGTKAQMTLFEEIEPERFKIVRRLADHYHFFHPMLEFIEVFWLKGGFDIICGNPPWIKYEFDEKGIISERFPEVLIRDYSAPEVRKDKIIFMSDSLTKDVYDREKIEMTCHTSFLSAMSNYPLLAEQKTNLYKCVLVNCFTLINKEGYIGLLTPESIYDDPKGQELRKEVYMRLRYHFQYQNELQLFSEVAHRQIYGDQIFGPRRLTTPQFLSISNLFHPNTIEGCFVHDGHGECGGIKDDKGNWNLDPHKDRIVYIGENELHILAKAYENSTNWESAKMVGIHNNEIMNVSQAFSNFKSHVRDYESHIDSCLNETISVDNGIIRRNTCYPNIDSYQMIYNGPQFYVGNPFYKTPRKKCKKKDEFDEIDLLNSPDDIEQRTNYTPCLSLNEYLSQVSGFPIGQDKDGIAVYDSFMDYYKVTMRGMLNQAGERALICAILYRKTAHIHAVVSTIFRDNRNCVDMAALCMSLPLDFFVKTIGIGQLGREMLESFPMGVDFKYLNSLRSRTLRLNCLSIRYSELWEEVWDDLFKSDNWSIDDNRLASWDELVPTWQHSTPLRNYFERRLALVEIDVISAMALGLSLKELIMMYKVQFPVLQDNEKDTWYDAKGNIVFTCSKGLTGVGLDRKQWETMRGDLSEDGMVYFGKAPTFEHTIDPKKSELYGGQKVTYYAPYNRQDRIKDYERAWEHFDKIFNAKNE